MRRALLAALTLTAVATAAEPAAPPPASAAAPAGRWLCLPARAGDPCPKGSSLDEREVDACLARLRGARRWPTRVRLDGGPWVEAPSKGWRCVALPAAGRVRIEVENRGRITASWRLAPDDRCAGGLYDLEPGNFYGASYAACSRRRDHRRDERVP